MSERVTIHKSADEWFYRTQFDDGLGWAFIPSNRIENAKTEEAARRIAAEMFPGSTIERTQDVPVLRFPTMDDLQARISERIGSLGEREDVRAEIVEELAHMVSGHAIACDLQWNDNWQEIYDAFLSEKNWIQNLDSVCWRICESKGIKPRCDLFQLSLEQQADAGVYDEEIEAGFIGRVDARKVLANSERAAVLQHLASEYAAKTAWFYRLNFLGSRPNPKLFGPFATEQQAREDFAKMTA